MFWVGLFSGIIFYLIFTIIVVQIAKRKIKKQKQKEQDYQYIVKNEIDNNRKNN